MSIVTGLGNELARAFSCLRLRHKCALSMSIATLVSVIIASWLAVAVVLRGLDAGLLADTNRQLDVGLRFVIRNVERLGEHAVRLSEVAELAEARRRGDDGRVASILAEQARYLPSALVQIAAIDGEIVAERIVGGFAARFAGLGVEPTAALVQAALRLERRVAIEQMGSSLVIRASAPVVDFPSQVVGAAILSLPLDSAFADEVKSALGSHVLLIPGVDGSTPAQSTFVDSMGAREAGLLIPADVAARVARGKTILKREQILGREYAVGYTPLSDIDGKMAGILGVALDRAPIVAAKSAAARSIVLGALAVFLFSLALANLLSRRITEPIARLHQGVVAISRGDLDHRISVGTGDEIGDLAGAFHQMTQSLAENQARLAARMRELLALHDASRAVSSVIDLEQVLEKIVDSVASVFDVSLCALWITDAPVAAGAAAIELRPGALWIRRGLSQADTGQDISPHLAEPVAELAREVARRRTVLRVDRVAEDPRARAALAAGIQGPLQAVPLERKGGVIGVIVVGRGSDAPTFTEADSNLLVTFADQAAAAVENAQLYAQVRALNEDLEAKVHLRTAELTDMNEELGRTIRELRETQAQLILSERLAGMGLLVAGVAHEINSPTAAIRGSSEALGPLVRHFTEAAQRLMQLPVEDGAWPELFALVSQWGPVLAGERLRSPAAVWREARQLRKELQAAGLDRGQATSVSRALAELGAPAELIDKLRPFLRPASAEVVTGYLSDYVDLHRNAATVGHAIDRIQRIVGRLKSYSHADREAAPTETDIHEGIENTLVLMDYVLREIRVTRRFGQLPRIRAYVDELNQVWTNLILNAVQAMGGEGHIVIETDIKGRGVVARITDDGPGVPNEAMAKIFDPFFTTKPQGEGTGLGLGIVRQIVSRHGGRVSCTSRPGETCFEVWLPAQQDRGSHSGQHQGASVHGELEEPARGRKTGG